MNTVRALTDLYASFKRPGQLNWSFGLDPCGEPDCRFSNIQASIIDDTGRLPRCNWQGIECKDWSIAIMYVLVEIVCGYCKGAAICIGFHTPSTATSRAFRPRPTWLASSHFRASLLRALATSPTSLQCAVEMGCMQSGNGTLHHAQGSF